MTQDEIIEMANKAYAIDDGKPLHPSALFHLEIFAKLVAQHEREECLKFCDEVAEHFPSSGFVGSYIGQKIRARGQA